MDLTMYFTDINLGLVSGLVASVMIWMAADVAVKIKILRGN